MKKKSRAFLIQEIHTHMRVCDFIENIKENYKNILLLYFFSLFTIYGSLHFFSISSEMWYSHKITIMILLIREISMCKNVFKNDIFI